MTKNIIAFQKGIIVTPNIGIDNRNLAMNVQAELMKFGYMLDYDALNQLGRSDAADIKDFHNEVIDYLKDMTGGKRNYQPIYPGFPQQVMDLSEYQLWTNQLVGYWNGGSFTPNELTAAKPTAFEHVKYKMILTGTEKDFQNIFTMLTGVGTSITPADMKVIVWFINNYTTLVFPDVMPFKENMSVVLGELITLKRSLFDVKLPKLTTTDVLRIIVHLSGGDTSLPAVPPKTMKQRYSRYGNGSFTPNPEREAFKFKSFKRAERKVILGLLENSNLDVRDMKLKDQRWIRIGEILHPGEYQGLFPRSYKAFYRLRNTKVVSWYGEVDAAFKQSFDIGLAKLTERPGEFMRRLDYLIRTNNEEKVQRIFNTFAKVGMNVSNKVLFEVYSHFEGRDTVKTNRSIMVKGARKRTPLPNLPAIKTEYVDAIRAEVFNIIKAKFALMPELGDCYIDEELKKIPLPTNMRSMNDALVPTIRGQRTPFGATKTFIRPFIHWYDERGNLDIDLHGFLFGKNSGTMSFGYNGNHSNSIGCYSGDVRHRRGACAEYVDINIEAATYNGYKYFLMLAHNFNGGKLSDIKECVAGVMEIEHSTANSTWLPDNIVNSMKLDSAAQMVMIGVFDLETKEYIHLDLDFGNFQNYVNQGQSEAFFKALQPYIELPKVSVYDLMLWHVESRGKLVTKETAATHFMFEDFSSSYTKTFEYLGV